MSAKKVLLTTLVVVLVLIGLLVGLIIASEYYVFAKARANCLSSLSSHSNGLALREAEVAASEVNKITFRPIFSIEGMLGIGSLGFAFISNPNVEASPWECIALGLFDPSVEF